MCGYLYEICCVYYLQYSSAITNCTVSEAALAELAELKALVAELSSLVETIIGAPIPGKAEQNYFKHTISFTDRLIMGITF